MKWATDHACGAGLRRATALAVGMALVWTAAPAGASMLETGKAACDPGNGGIQLPSGFCASVFAEGLVNARQIVTAPNGTVYVAVADARDGSSTGAIVALRDNDGDGHADEQNRFGDRGGNSVDYHDGWLYFAPNDGVVRYPVGEGNLEPAGPAQTLVTGLPETGDHTNKTVAVGDDDTMYVNIGSGSNACQVANRQPGSPGIDPCPELDVRAGVWKFSASTGGQGPKDGERIATGTRNMVALDIEPTTGKLIGAQNGRDQLFENWPDRYTAADDLVLPAETLLQLGDDRDYGWPYCYYDPNIGSSVLAPEYGGDGTTVGRCGTVEEPLQTFPAHWAPLSMVFASPGTLGGAYSEGAFVAFHGSRFDPAAQPAGPGYNVVFVPFSGGLPSGDWSVFADGFAGDTSDLPDSAVHRPVGLATGPKGELYISDDRGGSVWRVVPTEGETPGGPAQGQAPWVSYVSGNSEVPAVDSHAWAWVELGQNEDGSVRYDARVFGLGGALAGHLHLGAPGQNGPVVVPLETPGVSGSSGCALADGNRTVVEPGDRENHASALVTPSGDDRCANLDSAACADVLDGRDLGDSAPSCGFADISGTINAEDLTGPLAGADVEELLSAMAAGKVYANFHTRAHPDGEIRGQVLLNTPR